MSNFTEEQLKELEITFNLKRNETLPVRDGVVSMGSMVWWRAEKGPERVNASEHWDNIRQYPQVYQLCRPEHTVTYED